MPAKPKHGVIVPLVTPATTDARLDEAAAERLLAHVAGAGCGVLVAGTTGEVASLSGSIRRRYVELAVRAVGGRLPVFACIAHNCLDTSVALARAHLEAGVDGVVAMLPNYFKLDAVEMRAYFTQLAAAVPGPLYLYNIPTTTGMSLPVDVIAALSELENVVGLKDSEATPGRRDEVANRLGRRPDFALFMGSAAQSVAALRLGFQGLVPSSGNLRPDWWRGLYDAALAGDWATADELQRKTDALAAVYQQGRSLGASLAVLKCALAEHGLCTPHVFPPLLPVSEATRAEIRQQLTLFS